MSVGSKAAARCCKAAWLAISAAAIGGAMPAAQAQSPGSAAGGAGPVYRCEGPPVLYTDALSAKEAKERGCRLLEGAPITVIQSPARRVAPPAPTGPRAADTRVDPGEQRARDSDARRILDAELRREQERLEALRQEYNNGSPERRGDEANYQKYLDRVASLKADIERKENDIAAIKRELAKLPS